MVNLKKRTQTSDVLKHLQEHEYLTSLEAFNKFGATRLSAIIFNLRKEGYNIVSEYETITNRYDDTVRIAVYHYLGKDEENNEL